MSDPLADLKRRAYARPDSESAASDARAELARIAEHERRVAHGEALPRPEIADHATIGARALLALALAFALVLAAAVAIAAQPRSSLDVFARPQAADDVLVTEFPVAMASVRRLPGVDGIDLFAARAAFTGDVCLAVVSADGAGMSCTSETDFRRSGIQMQLFHGAYQEGPNVVITWGPAGEPVVDAR